METSQRNFDITALSDRYYIDLGRYIFPADVRKQKLSQMSGFKVTWHYSGMEVESEAKYYNNTKDNLNSTVFVRFIPKISDNVKPL